MDRGERLASVGDMTVRIRFQQGSPRTILIRTRTTSSIPETMSSVSSAVEAFSNSLDGWRVGRVVIEWVQGRGGRPQLEIVLRQTDDSKPTPSESTIAAACEQHGL